MQTIHPYEVAIIGGSYAGLSAAMALGRALRNVVVIDGGKPCNRQTPHSHNFLTQDGETPAAILDKARQQVIAYDSVSLLQDHVTVLHRTTAGFLLQTEQGQYLHARKVLLAGGISDELPPVKGLAECWGISAIHCPYCHGYEFRQRSTGILANGDTAMELVKLISNWTSQLRLFTNGPSTLSSDQLARLQERHITVYESPVKELHHAEGYLSGLTLADGDTHILQAIYLRPAFSHHAPFAQTLGCELSETGHLKVDPFQKTTVAGIYAAGDCTSPMRSVARAVAEGSMAGAAMNKELIEEDF